MRWIVLVVVLGLVACGGEGNPGDGAGGTAPGGSGGGGGSGGITGDPLEIQPAEVTIPAGSRQLLRVEDATGVEWSASGGELGTETDPYERTWFRAETPGDYSVTATLAGPEPRIGSVTVHVIAAVSPVRGFRGVGGQLGESRASFGHWDLAVDAQGTLWAALPDHGGLATWRDEDGAWMFRGDAKWAAVEGVLRLADGDLLALGPTSMRRLEVGAGAWTTVSDSLPPEARAMRRAVGPDGTLYAMPSGWDDLPGLMVLAPGASAFEEQTLPDGVEVQALAFGPGGVLYLAGKDAADETVVFRREAGTDAWSSTGPVPSPDEPIRDLLVDAEGVLHLAGLTLARLAGGGWETTGPFATCSIQECGLHDLALRADGSLLVVESTELYARQADGTFSVVGTTLPEMHPEGRVRRPLRRVADAPDGTLYLRGDMGVFRLAPEGGTWSVLGEVGIPPNAMARALLVDPDGSWTLAAGGWNQPGHSLYRRAAGGGPWTGFGDAIGRPDTVEPVTDLARDGDGNLYGVSISTPYDNVFVIDPETGDVETLPHDERLVDELGRTEVVFGVTSDGTIFAAGSEWDEWHIYRLDHGATSWREDRGLASAADFALAPDGTFWALEDRPVRRDSRGIWTPVHDGLPEVGQGADLAVAPDGALLLADAAAGVFRLAPGASTWERVGSGEPTLGATFVAANGGRTWAAVEDRVFELDGATQVWLPLDVWVPIQSTFRPGFTAAADGSLVMSRGGVGVVQSFDGP